jgi:hypothetical protein
MLQTSCFTAQHKHVCTTEYSRLAQRGNWSSSSEAGGSLSQDVFSQMGAHRASDAPFDRARPYGKALNCVEGKGEVILPSTKKVLDSAMTGEVTHAGWRLVAWEGLFILKQIV